MNYLHIILQIRIRRLLDLENPSLEACTLLLPVGVDPELFRRPEGQKSKKAGL